NDSLYSLQPISPSSVLILRKSKLRCPASACRHSSPVIFTVWPPSLRYAGFGATRTRVFTVPSTRGSKAVVTTLRSPGPARPQPGGKAVSRCLPPAPDGAPAVFGDQLLVRSVEAVGAGERALDVFGAAHLLADRQALMEGLLGHCRPSSSGAVPVEQGREQGVEHHVLLDVQKVRGIGHDLQPGARDAASDLLRLLGRRRRALVADDDERRHPDPGDQLPQVHVADRGAASGKSARRPDDGPAAD